MQEMDESPIRWNGRLFLVKRGYLTACISSHETGHDSFELSKILKLSPSAISRALKDHLDIAPETRQKVLDLARKLDYEPSLCGRPPDQQNTRVCRGRL